MDGFTIQNAVDVVIPMRNGAKTIGATFASACAQTRPPRKIIVVDDGSDDGGAELVRGHPLTEIIATPPMGVSHARNIGVRAARAEFVAILDCDDLWHADKLAFQLAVFDSHPEVDVVTCDELNVRGSGEIVPGTSRRPRFRGRPYSQNLGAASRLGGWSSSLVFRRTSFLETGGYDESLSFWEDLEFSLRMARNHVFDYCPRLLTFIVENPDSTTRRYSSPAKAWEIRLQFLSVMERQLGDTPSGLRIKMQCAQTILSHIVRDRIGWSGIAALRSQIEERAPALAARMPRNDVRFVLSLLVLSLPRYPAALRILWQMARRRLGRVSSSRHALRGWKLG